jgi:hypothetical protein
VSCSNSLHAAGDRSEGPAVGWLCAADEPQVVRLARLASSCGRILRAKEPIQHTCGHHNGGELQMFVQLRRLGFIDVTKIKKALLKLEPNDL